MSANYRVAPTILIRMAGVPFDVVERLATPETSSAARELVVRQDAFVAAQRVVEQLLHSREHGLSEPLFRAWRRAIRTGVLTAPIDAPSQAFSACWEAASAVAAAEAQLNEALKRELGQSRKALLESARTILPPYLVFVDAALRERLIAQSSEGGDTLPARNKQARAHERHLLLYLQRVTAKNDSLSAFGPEGWGTIAAGPREFSLAPEAGIAERHTFLERWTAHGAAAAINEDPAVRAELAPRLHPGGRIDAQHFIFADARGAVALDEKTAEILRLCDGRTPAHATGVALDVWRELADREMIIWKLEVPALAPDAFAILLADVAAWRPGETRERWLRVLGPIAALPEKFAAAASATETRVAIIREADERLQLLGVARKAADRFLYSAGNPIGEECLRECHFSIGQELIDEAAHDAAPWIDLWRDCYAFAAGRVAAGLRGLLEKAPLQDGAISLAAFMRHCENLKAPLHGPVMVGLAHAAFAEVKGAFRDHFSARAEAREWELSAADCRFVRDRFDYPKFDEYTYPSADLQIAATSPEAVQRGEYQWILAELHPPVAMLHHGFYWSCPDKPALSHALASTVCGKPSFHFGFFAADFTATTTVRQLDALPDLTSFVARERSSAKWKTISPAETEVYVENETGDVCLREHGTRKHLGSFARAWVIPLGFHPFLFSLERQTPRLRCGKVIVQRRSWTVGVAELPAGKYSGVSRDLVTAIERLRAARGWPRFIYIRPTEAALRRSGAEGRDKDTKPVFIDLESYLFLEIFHRWLTKTGELEITEMVPDPEHLVWREADGRRTFELRTLIVPNP